MLLTTSKAPVRHTPLALPDDGTPLTAGASLFGAPLTHRTTLTTSRGSLLLRPVVPTDAAAIDRFIRRLSPATRARRFHTGLTALTPRQLAGLVDVDHLQRETLVAVRDGQVVAVAQFLQEHEPEGAVELAIVVDDAWQGLGVGRAMLSQLATAAEAAGHVAATALVQADNAAVLHLLQSLGGDRVEVARHGAVVEALIRFRDADHGRGTGPMDLWDADGVALPTRPRGTGPSSR